MSQHHGPRFESGSPLEFLRQRVPNSAQPRMTKLVFFSSDSTRPVFRRGEFRSLRDHHDAEVTPASMSHANLGRNFIDIERLLRNEDHVGATGNTAVDGDPAGI